MIDFDSAPGGDRFSNVIPFTRKGAPVGFEEQRAAPSGEVPAFVDALNDRQREAVLATDGPLIVLAGAGSGKTKMLTSRIAYLIETGRAAPHQILAVTFTNKAAAEMRERVERTLLSSGGHGGLGAPEIGTFHSVCVRLLRREGARTPFTAPFVIYDDADQLSLLKSVVQKLALDDKAFSPKAFQAAINRAKCDAVEPQDLQPAAHNLFDRKLKEVYEQYQKDLFANNAIDFGEIITLTYRLLRDHPDIREKYQRRFRYIHVDEYQDTNRAQYLLLQTLANPTHGGHGNICVVGDEDQSIYKWRGADIRNILDFENDYPGAQVVKLEQNYRSTQTIITAASTVIRNNKERKDKTLWTENEKGLPVLRYQLPDERAEAELVVSEIKRLCQHEGRSYNDFAIFYRTHAQSRQFEDVLRREKIGYKIVGGLRFYDRKEIKDVLSYFKAILNRSDSVSLKRVVNVPARGIGKTTLDKLEEFHTRLQLAGGDSTTYWDALKQAASDPGLVGASASRKIAPFVQLMERLAAEQPKLLLSELYHLILDETGYVRELRKENTEESLARIENLEEFDTLLQEFEEDFFQNVPEEESQTKKAELLPVFLEQSSLASDVDRKDGQDPGPSIVLMTLHSSKGLEYPVVFLPGMEEGLFPSVRAWEETPDEDIEEERRLCYVGMTRAREVLYLSNVVVRRLWGNVNYQEPARFFGEMPDELIEFHDLSQGQRASQFRPGSSRGYGFRERGYDDHEAPVIVKGRSFDDFSQASPSDDDEISGRKLHHPEYGSGTIVFAEGSGQDAKVTVDFGGGKGRRKFLLRFVKDYVK